MQAYSIDLRQRSVAAVERGMPRVEVATTFGVSLSTIKRLLARRRRDETDPLAAQVPPGRRRTISPDQHAALWTHLEQYRDVTIATHTEVWNAAQGTGLSQWTVGRAIRQLGWTRKKSIMTLCGSSPSHENAYTRASPRQTTEVERLGAMSSQKS